MTADDIKEYIQAIADHSVDPEVAHSMEDGLYTDVLLAIANGAPNAQELAKEALKTADLEFPRWCA